MSTNTFDQSAFMAGRSLQYAQTGPAPQPHVFCLPAAKMAIGHEDLKACNDAAKPEHEVTAALNQVWRQNNAAVIDEQEKWVRDDYLPALKRIAEARQRAQAEMLEKQAAFERLVAEDPELR